jgi:hypothetical protein
LKGGIKIKRPVLKIDGKPLAFLGFYAEVSPQRAQKLFKLLAHLT